MHMYLADFIDPALRESLGERIHTIPQQLLYVPDAADLLAEALRTETNGHSAVVLFDTRTRSVAGEGCVAALQKAAWQVEEFLIPDRDDGTWPACDDHTQEALQARLPEADVYVAVGSGVVNDLTKWLAVEKDRPYAVYATAASMNGYAAANVAPMINGVKALFRGQAPRVIAAQPKIIEGAPAALTTAGLGDVLAKPVSTMDWLMNNMIFDEDYSHDIAGIISRVEPLYLDRPEAINEKDPKAIRGLFEALVLSGCAMTLQGSSLPASGGEHLISHTLDMKAHIEGTAHDLHGRQVGVATLFAAALYERILKLDRPVFPGAALSLDRGYWKTLADVVGAQHQLAVARQNAAIRHLEADAHWNTLQERLLPLFRPPAVVKACLQKSGAAHRLEDISCSRKSFCDAVRNAASIRERFTSMDLGWVTGLLPDAIEEIVEEWLVN